MAVARHSAVCTLSTNCQPRKGLRWSDIAHRGRAQTIELADYGHRSGDCHDPTDTRKIWGNGRQTAAGAERVQTYRHWRRNMSDFLNCLAEELCCAERQQAEPPWRAVQPRRALSRSAALHPGAPRKRRRTSRSNAGAASSRSSEAQPHWSQVRIPHDRDKGRDQINLATTLLNGT